MTYDVEVLRAIIDASNDDLVKVLKSSEGLLDTFSKKTWSGPKITVDDSDARTKLTGLQTQLTNLKSPTITPQVNTTAAHAQISGLEQRIQRLQNSGYRQLRAGSILTATITAPIVAGGTEVTRYAMDFEASMARSAALTEIGRKGIEAYKKQILDLVRDDRIVSAPKELGDAFFFAASKTKSGADAMGVLRASAIGAAGDLGKVQDIVEGVTTALNAYHLGGDQASHVTDIFVQSAKEGGVAADTFAKALPKVVATASVVGISLEEVAASIATMTRVGIPAGNAATALNRLLLNMEKPSKQAQEAVDKLGLSFGQLRIELKDKGLLAVLDEVVKKAGNHADILAPIFGSVNSFKAVMATAGSQADTYAHILDKMFHSQGAAAEAAAIASGKLEGRLNHLKGVVAATAIEFGDRFLPELTSVAETMGKNLPGELEHAIRAWQMLPTPIKDTALAIVALLALAGPVNMMAGNIKILGAALLGLGDTVGVNGAVMSIRSLYTLLRSGVGLSGAVGLSGIGESLAGVGTAMAILLPFIAAGTIAWIAYKDNLDKVNEAHDALDKNTGNLKADLQGMASAATGNAGAERRVKLIAAEAQDAGTDLQKLGKALDDTTRAKHEIKNLGLDPVAARVLEDEYERLASRLEQRIIKVKTELDASSQTMWDWLKSAAAGGGEVLYDATGGALGGKAPGPKKFDASTPQQRQGATMSTMVSPGIPGVSPQQLHNLQRAAELTQAIQGSTAKIRVDAMHALDIGSLSEDSLKKIHDAYLGRFRSGYSATEGEDRALGDVNNRLKSLADKRKADAQKANDTATEQARLAAAAQQQIEEENASRIRRILAQQMQARAEVWNRYASLVEGMVGRVREIEEQGSDVGSRTQKAKVEAELAKREFAEIPSHVKQWAVELAGVEDKMKDILDLRNGFKELFTGMAKGMTAAQFTQFKAQVGGVEDALGLDDKFSAQQARYRQLAPRAITYSDQQREYYGTQGERLSEAGKRTGDVYLTGATSAVGAKVAAMSDRLESVGRAAIIGADQHCQHLARVTFEQISGAYSAYFKGTAAKSMHAFERAGIGHPYRPGESLAPGSLLYNGSSAGGYGHVMTYGASGTFNDQHGARRTPLVPIQYVVPPPGAASIPANTKVAQTAASVPALTINKTPAQPYTLPGSPEFDTSLLDINNLPRAWGGMMADHIKQAGEVTAAREAMEAMLQKQLADHPDIKISDAAMTKARVAANFKDITTSVNQTEAGMRGRIQELYKSIRLVGRDNNPYLALEEEFAHGANRYAYNQKLRGEMLTATLGAMVTQTQQATREFVRDRQNESKPLSENAGLLGAGYNPAAYDRAKAMTAARVAVYNSADIVAMNQVVEQLNKEGKYSEAAAKAKFIHEEATRRLTAAEQAYTAAAVEGALHGYADSQRAQQQSIGLLEYEAQLLKANTLSREAQSRALEVEKVRRETLNSLAPAVASAHGKAFFDQLKAGAILPIQAQAMAGSAGTAKAAESGLAKTNEATRAQQDYADELQRSLDLLRQQARLYATMPSYSPELARQIELMNVREQVLKQFAGKYKTGANGDVSFDNINDATSFSQQLQGETQKLNDRLHTEAVKEYAGRAGDLDRTFASLGDSTGILALQFDLMNTAFGLGGDRAALLDKTLRNLKATMDLDTTKRILGEQSQGRSQYIQSARGKLDEELRLRDATTVTPPEVLPAQRANDARLQAAADLQDANTRLIHQDEVVRDIQMETARNEKQRVAIAQAYAAKVREILGITESQAEKQRDVDERQNAAITDRVNRLKKEADTVQSAFGDALFNGLSGKKDVVRDFFKKLWDDVLRDFSERAAVSIRHRLFDRVLNRAAGGVDTGAPATGAPATATTNPGYTGSFSGSELVRGGVAAAHGDFFGAVTTLTSKGRVPAAGASPTIQAGSVSINGATVQMLGARVTAVGARIDAPGANITGTGGSGGGLGALGNVFGGSTNSVEQLATGAALTIPAGAGMGDYIPGIGILGG